MASTSKPFGAPATGAIGRRKGRKHGRQAGLELLDYLAEGLDLRPLATEEALEQLFKLRHVVDAAAHDLLVVLDQHRLRRLLEDDVGPRVSAAQFAGDLGVEVVLAVLRLPVANGTRSVCSSAPST
jgi:hypothetical protein